MASHRHIWQLTWPMILSNLSVPILGLVDTAILGHLPEASHLAGVSLGASVITFLFWAFGFLRMGTTSQVARHLGGNRLTQVKRVIGQSLLLACIIGLTLASLSSLIGPGLLALTYAPEPILIIANDYAGIRLLGAPVALLHYVLIGILLGYQKTRLALVITVIINVANIILDYWFIMGLGWASKGAAWATVIAETTGIVIGFGYLLKTPLLAKLNFRQAISDRASMRQLLGMNRDLFIRTICLLFVFLFFAALGAQQGATLLAANAILLQLLSFCAFSLDGFAHCCETLTGYALGRQKPALFWQICRRTSLWAIVTALLLTLILAIGQPLIIGLLTSIEPVRAAANEYYYWLLALPLVSMSSYQLDGIFIGIGATTSLRKLMILCVGGVFLPLWLYFQFLGNHGLWLALLGFNLMRGLTLGLALWQKRHRLFNETSSR